MLKLTFVISLLATVGVCYLILTSSARLVRFLGETGINVMMRLMGLIVMAIAVDFFLSGIHPSWQSF